MDRGSEHKGRARAKVNTRWRERMVNFGMAESRGDHRNPMDFVSIRLVIDGNELATSVPSCEIPKLIDRWFDALPANADQREIDALTARLRAGNDKLDALVKAYTPKP